MTQQRISSEHPYLQSPESKYWKDNRDVFLVITDRNMIIRYISENCEKTLGYKREELVGKSCVGFMHPEEVVDNLNRHETVVKGAIREDHVRVQGRDGKFTRLVVHVIPVMDPASGELKEIRTVCRIRPD